MQFDYKKHLANRILKTISLARWIVTKQDRYLKTFSNEPTKLLGKLSITVTNNGWTCEEACLTVVEDRHKPLIGRDLFNSLGLAVVQRQVKRGICVINVDNSTCTLKKTIASQFPQLVQNFDLSNTQVVKSKFD